MTLDFGEAKDKRLGCDGDCYESAVPKLLQYLRSKGIIN